MRKLFLFGSAGIILTVLVLSLFISKEEISEEIIIKIKEAETSIEKEGIQNIALFYPKYQKVNLEYYYRYDYCSDVIDKVIEDFEDFIDIKKNKKIRKINRKIFEKFDLNLEESEINLPIIILEGKADIYDSENNYFYSEDSFKTVINGVSACSKEILTYNLCRYLNEPLDLCNIFSYNEEYNDLDKYKPSDFVCYDSCNIEYASYNTIISQNWQGPPCSKVSWYIDDESRLTSNQCYSKDSCKSQADDIGCCLKSQCVNDEKCYEPFTVLDVGSDGQKEVCVKINESGYWINADRDKETCNAMFKWFDCSGSKCKQGIDNYDKKENGLCCGDDKNEQSVKCEGKICDRFGEEDFACCNENSCVYNGKCYSTGCTELRLNSGEEINVYCNNGRWEDLDDNFCSECIGKEAWSGLVCCGDDLGEGKYPTRFIYNNKEGSIVISYDSCTDKKNNCIFPESINDFIEGCYEFNNNKYLEGGYYCSESQWYDLDNKSDFCEECGFNWLTDCCGDDKDEHYIEGLDNTFSCCSSATDIVVDRICYATAACGNDVVNDGEDCELPESKNNKFCKQTAEQCFGAKLGIRDSSGNCQSDCTCSEDEFGLRCVKGACGAACSFDSDCGNGNICDQSTCSCREKTFCGDGIVQEKNDDDWNEKCELPDTLFNPYCNETKQCFGIKTGIRYDYGSCSNNCQCYYLPFQKICIKGSCGAECNEDGTGCGKGKICEKNTCSCVNSEIICGNDICEDGEIRSCPKDCIEQECPYRLIIELNEEEYYVNDTININVYVYDRDNNLMPGVEFDLEFIVNNNLIGESTYSTNSLGYYEIKKSVKSTFQSGQYDFIAYIAKTKRPECEIIAGSDNAFVYIGKQEPILINLSGYKIGGFSLYRPALNTYSTAYSTTYSITSVIYDYFNMITTHNQNFSISERNLERETFSSVCGNDVIEIGEVCEGSDICRISSRCNYEKRTYDIPEPCISCYCPTDLKSDPDDGIYCNNCDAHCGDGVINCNEQCESETLEFGNFCRYEKLYHRVDACVDCNWYDDSLENDILINDCYCKCPESPNKCIDGNWIEYRESYNAGCADGACNACNCEDIYVKDSNHDGLEDKCSPEICDNGIDDNDNGLTDMKDNECSLCGNCGIGKYNLCDRNECEGFNQSCYFNKILFNFGKCHNCSSATCEDYSNDLISCSADSCSLGNCYWDGFSCCTDKDSDGICDNDDNCPDVHNPDQENYDHDEKGNACEKCIYEPSLFEPTGQKELLCKNGIDDDCDGKYDCNDQDCIGIENCCHSSSDCEQSSCVFESCINNNCIYQERDLCNNIECDLGYYCSSDRVCVDPETSEYICLNCVDDKTQYDEGIGFGFDLFDRDSNYNNERCCGDDENEHYIIQEENNRSACCNSATACIDSLGNCVDSNNPDYEGHNWHCSINGWYECSENRHLLCAEAGSTYNQGIEYKANKETGWYCTYDGFTWSWKSFFPKEVCDDGIDNNCNGLADIKDPYCPSLNINNTDTLI